MDGEAAPGPAVPGLPDRPRHRQVAAVERQELELLRAAVEGGLEGMVLVSPEGVMVTYNRKFQEIWPIPVEVVASGSDEGALASVLDKLADPEGFLARVRELYARAAGTARDELLLLDGRVLDRYGAALHDPAGQYIGWAWYFRDITAERAAAVDAERLGALMTVAQALADARSEDEVLSVVTGHGAAVLGAQGSVLCLVEPAARHVRVLATSFFDEDLRAEVAEMPADFPLPLVHAAVTGEPVFLADRAEAVRLYPAGEEVYVRARTEGAAAVPMTVHGTTIGSLAVAFETPHTWGAADRALLQALAALTGQALDRLRAEQAEREATREIRRLSEALQRSLLPEPPQTDLLQMALRYQPAARQAQVGGDWYDAFPTPDGCMTLVVGDVAGHDSNAAAAMAQVRNLLRGIAQIIDGPPSVVLSALDRALVPLEVTALATAVLCQTCVDPGTGTVRLRWSNAGHPPPLLVGPDGTVDFLDPRPELLLGVRPEQTRTDHEVVLEPGATVLLYTDGLVERRGQTLDEGMADLGAAAADLQGLAPEEVCDALLDRLAKGAEDDVALLVLRVSA